MVYQTKQRNEIVQEKIYIYILYNIYIAYYRAKKNMNTNGKITWKVKKKINMGVAYVYKLDCLQKNKCIA